MRGLRRPCVPTRMHGGALLARAWCACRPNTLRCHPPTTALTPPSIRHARCSQRPGRCPAKLARAGKHGRQAQRAGAAPCVGPGATTLAAPATQTHCPSAAASYTRQPLLPQVPVVKPGSASVVGSSGSQTGSGRKRAPEAGERESGSVGKRLRLPWAAIYPNPIARAWKYLPHTRHAYTLTGLSDTEQHFSKSKSRFCARARARAVRSRPSALGDGAQARWGAASATTGQTPTPASSRKVRNLSNCTVGVRRASEGRVHATGRHGGPASGHGVRAAGMRGG